MKLSIFYSVVFSFLIFNLANAESGLDTKEIDNKFNLKTTEAQVLLLTLKCASYKDVSIRVPTTLWMEIMYFDAQGKIQAESIPLVCRKELYIRHKRTIVRIEELFSN